MESEGRVRIRKRDLISTGKGKKLHIVEGVENGMVHVMCLAHIYEDEVVERISPSLAAKGRLCKRCQAYFNKWHASKR
jgi:hypothetical protein